MGLIRKSLGWVLISSLGAACGPSQEIVSTFRNSNWAVDCGLGGMVFRKLHFTDKEMTVIFEKYLKTGCLDHLYTFSHVYEYSLGETLGGEVAGFVEVKKLDLVLRDIRVTPMTANVQDDWNSRGFCGKFDWEAEVEFSLFEMVGMISETSTSTECPYYNPYSIVETESTSTFWYRRHVVDDPEFTIIKVVETKNKGKVLYLGKRESATSDGMTEERRPSQLDLAFGYKRL